MSAEAPTTFREVLRQEEPFKSFDETFAIARDSPLLPESCDRSNDSALLARLKDSGLYAEIYMAPDIQTAAEQFPDLGDTLRFTTAKGEYFCDSDCQYNARFVRSIMKGGSRRSITRKSSSMSYLHTQSESWWHQESWEMEQHWRKQRHVDSEVERLYDPESGRRRSSITELNSNITKSVSEKNFQSGTSSGRVKKPFAEVEFNDEDRSGINKEALQWQQRLGHQRFSKRKNGRQRRESINEPGTLERVNSGISKGIVGTTVALQCDDPDQITISTNGYHMCKTCRVVRQLPEGYFPRVLNEVICAEGICLHGEGACRQRFLPFKILRNRGSSLCPKWRLITIDLRTCCDCIVHPNSPFVKYVI
uniref:Bursicon n=1 Tax=Parascaris univalens TaxID=6257 RepID=A0A915BQI8_PARUN